MKQMSKVLVVAAVAVFLPVSFIAPTAAQQSGCSIENSGPGADSNCDTAANYRCEIDIDNNLVITSTTDQEGYSGSVEIVDNGEAGNGSTGSVSNNSGTNFSVVITNGANPNDPRDCRVAAVLPPTETPGSGQTETPEQPVQPSQPVTPRALPVTSGSSVPEIAVLAGTVALTAAVAFAYRRLHL